MTLLFWEWHLIQRWPLRCIFAQFPEQLRKDLVSWGSHGERFMIDRFLGDAFEVLSCQVLEYCSAVWCSAADTHLKLLDRAVSGARFLTGGVFECDNSHRRSMAVLCMLYKIRCNPGPYVPARVTCSGPVAHQHTYAPPRCRILQYSRTFIQFSVSLWNDLANPIFDGVGLAGFKSKANASLLAEAALSLL